VPGERHWPVAGGGTVVHHEPHDHGDGRRTMASSHFGPDGQFLGIMQMDLTPSQFHSAAFSPLANLKESLRLVRETCSRPWTTYTEGKYKYMSADTTDVFETITTSLRDAALHASEQAATAARAGDSRTAAEWADAARASLESLKVTVGHVTKPSSTAVEEGLRHAVTTLEEFLGTMVERLEGAGTETASRLAAEIRGVLDGVRDGRPQ
jgi:hypothetical protein